MKMGFARCGLVFGNIGVQVLDKCWRLSSLSPLSGQLTFKVGPDHWKVGDAEETELEGKLNPPRHQSPVGVNIHGSLLDVCRTLSYADLLGKCQRSLRALGLEFDGEKPFLAVENGYPYFTDGDVGMQLRWGHGVAFTPPTKPDHRTLRLALDPVLLSPDGQVLMPLQQVLTLTEQNTDVFADPFAERNMSRGGVDIAKQITPGMRQKVRAVRRGTKS